MHLDCVITQHISAVTEQSREPIRVQSLGEKDIWLGVVVLVLSQAGNYLSDCKVLT